MTPRLLVLAACESDLFEWMERHPDRTPWMAVWPTRYHKLEGLPAFDKLCVTAAASIMSAAIAACLTRVKGTDGLTVGQRITPDEVGARMRGTT